MKEKTNENEKIIEEILKKCSWWERIIVKRNKKLLLNIYHYARNKTANIFYL